MELYIEPIKRNHNAVNGQFLRGHNTWNKGKKWDELFDKTTQQRMLEPLKKGRIGGNPDIPGSNRIRIVGIKNGKFYGVFYSSEHAARVLDLTARNIRHCCHGNRHKCGGINWFFESEFDKWSKLIIDK